MNDKEASAAYDFGRLCRVFRGWYDKYGYSQSRLDEAGGPSGPVITKLYNGTWTSNRPRDITEKIDRGFGWPSNTAWIVLARMDMIAQAGEDEERALRAALRNAAGRISASGSHRDQRQHEAEKSLFDLEEFLNRQAAEVIAWIRGSVGGQGQGDGSYVEAPGDRVDHGEPKDETAAAIRAMREELLHLAARERDVLEQLNSMSTRLERWEIERAKSVDGTAGQAGPDSASPSD